MIMGWLLLLLGVPQAERPDPAPMSDEAFSVLARFLDYDAGQLEARIVDEETFEVYQLEKLVFNGAGEQRVPAVLAVPRVRRPPYPVVFLIHELGESKQAWWSEGPRDETPWLTRRLLATGHAVLVLDLPGHGERTQAFDFAPPDRVTFTRARFHRLREIAVSAVIDHRRALDYLETREDLDAERVGAVGTGYGALVAMMTAAIDDRLDCSVLVATPFVGDPTAVFGAHHFAPRLGGHPILMSAGKRNDAISEEETKTLYALIPGGEKELIFHDGRGPLPERQIETIIFFLKKRLRGKEPLPPRRGGG